MVITPKRGEPAGPTSERVAINESFDVFVARWAAWRLADGIGFPVVSSREIVIVVSELATNILKYGVRGEIAMDRVEDAPEGVGLRLVAADDGPPLADLELALRDGYGDRGPIDPAAQLRRGGIGAGLGAVQRLSDVFEYRPRGPGQARKSFHVIRYLRRPRRR